jgi:hypothetical protein
MIDAVESLLNNAVDFYVQAVDYCRISTSQILTPVGAGIRQIRSEFGDVRQISSDSGDTCQIPAKLAGIWPELPDPAVLAKSLAGNWPGRLASGQLARFW